MDVIPSSNLTSYLLPTSGNLGPSRSLCLCPNTSTEPERAWQPHSASSSSLLFFPKNPIIASQNYKCNLPHQNPTLQSRTQLTMVHRSSSQPTASSQLLFPSQLSHCHFSQTPRQVQFRHFTLTLCFQIRYQILLISEYNITGRICCWWGVWDFGGKDICSDTPNCDGWVVRLHIVGRVLGLAMETGQDGPE